MGRSAYGSVAVGMGYVTSRDSRMGTDGDAGVRAHAGVLHPDGPVLESRLVNVIHDPPVDDVHGRGRHDRAR